MCLFTPESRGLFRRSCGVDGFYELAADVQDRLPLGEVQAGVLSASRVVFSRGAYAKSTIASTGRVQMKSCMFFCNFQLYGMGIKQMCVRVYDCGVRPKALGRKAVDTLAFRLLIFRAQSLVQWTTRLSRLVSYCMLKSAPPDL